MTEMNFNHNNTSGPQGGSDELDVLLREWHDENRIAAERGRDALLARLAQSVERSEHETETSSPASPRLATPAASESTPSRDILWSFLMHRYTRFAATVTILVTLIAILFPPVPQHAVAQDGVLMLPDGGRLDAFDADGEAIGPCPLRHTDVNVQISGFFSRTTLKQTYHNTYDRKIEAVYTFPMSQRAAVDRMTMTIGDRVIEGEVKERTQARRIYEAARTQGYVASLLEQERPNIFTQSVANIEPGAEVIIEISYVEVLEARDGEYSFQFPMTVAPRYIPGSPIAATVSLPEGLQLRHGVVLAGPGVITTFPARNDAVAERIHRALHTAIAIRKPADAWWKGAQPEVLHQFVMEYPLRAPGCRCMAEARCRCAHTRPPLVEPEVGIIYRDGTGHLGGRWFYTDIAQLDAAQSGSFSPNTNQVPDASRITPMPVHPETRAGHDITVSVTIDTGGPALRDVKSHQHEIIRHGRFPAESQAMFVLAKGREIPNRDFVLTWRTSGDSIQESIFTHTGEYGSFAGGFFTLVLQPPDRVDDEMARPRELIFVLDNSGSMRSSEAQLGTGVSAIDAAKRVINRAIDTMRPNDRFNVISFNNTLDVLWSEPRENTAENRAAAQRYVDARQGGGGTEMANAVYKALEAPRKHRSIVRPHIPRLYSPTELADLPPDGRQLTVLAPLSAIEVRDAQTPYVLRAPDGREIALELRAELPTVLQPEGVQIMMTGHWLVPTVRGRAVFMVGQIEMVHDHDDADLDEPMRIVLFVTDGLVGNDDAIVRAIRENAKRTRVFTIGMSRSPNRHLLDEMAIAGRGAADYVLPDQDVEAIVDRFAQRIATPVLTDIELLFTGDARLSDVVVPGLLRLEGMDRLPDLYDAQPLVIHGRYEIPKALRAQGEDAVLRGALIIRGRTGAGRYERTIDLELPAHQPQHDVIARLWAREKVGEVSRAAAGTPNAHAQREIIALGEAFQIMTQHTSFVAVEKMRITVGGKPMLVRVPIELPKDMAWEGIFGPSGRDAADDVVVLGRRVERLRGQVESLNFKGSPSFELDSALSQPARNLVPGSGGGPVPGRDVATGKIRVLSDGASPSSAPPIPASDASPPPVPRMPSPPPPPARDLREMRASEGERERSAPRREDEVQLLSFSADLPFMHPQRTTEAGQRGNFGVSIGSADAFRAEDALQLRERYIGESLLLVHQLLAAGLQQEAADVLDEVLSIDDANELAQSLRRVIEQDKIGHAESEPLLKELAIIAAREVKRLEAARREAELARKLDPQLRKRIAMEEPSGVLVAVLLDEIDDAALESLREAGLTIEAAAQQRSFVIGRIRTDTLESFALLDVVRRVELVEGE